MTPNELARHGIQITMDGVRRSAFELLRYPHIEWSTLIPIWPELLEISPTIQAQLEIDALYAGYMDRQESDINSYLRDENLLIPTDLDFSSIGSLSTEIRQKLTLARPQTLGAASRIPGITPAALTSLLRHLKKRKNDAA
jgi:tRNA uridine 5-carboxymethylaminomethyl modification enzyme